MDPYMNWKAEYKPLFWTLFVFAACYYLPLGNQRFDQAIMESLHLVQWYAREHVILCLIPAFFIAGAIAAYINQGAVLKYLGAEANKIVAYSVASLSGSVLAVCSCTILPLFTGIYKMGAGLGPATAFLYAGPAINVLAIILTARILGPEIGFARAILAVFFSIILGLIMHFLYRGEERDSQRTQAVLPDEDSPRPLYATLIYFGCMIAILVFANWGEPADNTGIWAMIYGYKWLLTSISAVLFALVLMVWYQLPKLQVLLGTLPVLVTGIFIAEDPRFAFVAGAAVLAYILGRQENENGMWIKEAWGFARQIMPLLLFGVLIAGLLLGRPGGEGIIPSGWVSSAVGGNSLTANFFASFAGAFMYFATLTEVPILQGLIGSGMGKGPALALLLAGPALSLPNMLVIRSVIGTGKTIVFVSLVVIMATVSGYIYGLLS